MGRLGMNHHDQRAHVVSFFLQAHRNFGLNGIQLVELKGSDYSPEPIAMTEVFFTAADIDTDVPQVLWVHVRKHLSAIATYMQDGKLKSEDIRSRLLDVANYMALIDSYVADPARWLRYLHVLILRSEFPNRSEEEINLLSVWLDYQLRKHGAIINGTNPLLDILRKADPPR